VFLYESFCVYMCLSVLICVCLCLRVSGYGLVAACTVSAMVFLHESVCAYMCLVMAGGLCWQLPPSAAMVSLYVSVCVHMCLTVLICVCLCLCVYVYGRCPLVAVSTIRYNGVPGWSLDQIRSACKSAVMSSSPRSGCLSRTSSTPPRLR